MKLALFMVLTFGSILSAHAGCEGICSYLKPETGIAPHKVNDNTVIKAANWETLINDCKTLVVQHSGLNEAEIVVSESSHLSEIEPILDSGKVVVRLLGIKGQVMLRNEMKLAIGPISKTFACLDEEEEDDVEP